MTALHKNMKNKYEKIDQLHRINNCSNWDSYFRIYKQIKVLYGYMYIIITFVINLINM